MRLAIYTAASIALAGLSIYNAMSMYSQFYSICVYLSRHSASFMALMNVVLLGLLYLGKTIQWVFIGPLRVIEVEHLYERAWFSVSETCLAMTIFRNDFDTRFILLFALMLLVKCFHWLCQDRVEFMEQVPELPKLFYPRLVTLMLGLWMVDAGFLYFAYYDIMATGPSMMYMFAFEFVILVASITVTFLRFIIYAIDRRQPDVNWDNKSTYVFYLDLVNDFCKLVAYASFFAAVLQDYGLPIHIIRDLYMTTRSFLTRIKEMLQYRRATQNMNERYPTVSEAELGVSDRTCIICRDDMHISDNPKRLPCGHVFHFRCLRSWLERQQTCPTCRSSVMRDPEPSAAPIVPDIPAPGVDGNAPPVPANNAAPVPPNNVRPADVPRVVPVDNQTSPQVDANASTSAFASIPASSRNFASSSVRLIPLFAPGTRPHSLAASSDTIKLQTAGIPPTISSLTAEQLGEGEVDAVKALQTRLAVLNSLRQEVDDTTAKVLSQLAAINHATGNGAPPQ